MLLNDLKGQSDIIFPSWLSVNTQYLCQMGSVAYGVSGNSSDIDVYGFAIPPKEMVFPHLGGHIAGFGAPPQTFEQWSQHHIVRRDNGNEYDVSVYGIVKYFEMLRICSPNIIDSLFVPRRCILHTTGLFERIREKRKIFLHKGAFHKFRGYAFAQMTKIRQKQKSSNERRQADIAEHGFDTKHAYHVLRLALECEQILVHHDLDLERDREILKSVRRGEWKLEEIEAWFTDKERRLEDLYGTSSIPYEPDEVAIRGLLLESLETHYGSLDKAVASEKPTSQLVREMDELLARFR